MGKEPRRKAGRQGQKCRTPEVIIGDLNSGRKAVGNKQKIKGGMGHDMIYAMER